MILGIVILLLFLVCVRLFIRKIFSRVIEEKCLEYSNGKKNKANECKINSMNPEHIQCHDNPEEAGYNGSILLSSPAYPLKVETDVRNFLITEIFSLNNQYKL